MDGLLKLLSILISIKSTIINDKRDFEYLERHLNENNIKTEIFSDESKSVYNLYGEYIGDQSRANDIDLMFLGHLDIVPAGELELWKGDPFNMTIKDDIIHGRGAVDMKSSNAAFVQAFIDLIKEKKLNRNIAIAITGDEETESNGAKTLLRYLKDKNKTIKQILVGEPTSDKIFGDYIKNGRRGSANFDLIVYGVQGHVAYPEKSDNPINYVAKILNELIKLKFDNGNEFFILSHLEITSINVENKARNVIPGSVKIQFNIRYNDLQTLESLERILNEKIRGITKNYELKNISNSESFLSKPNDFSEKLREVIKKHCNCEVKYSTSGGTSDGRFLHEIASIIEFGPLNESAHKINENISLSDFKKLYEIYYDVLSEISI